MIHTPTHTEIVTLTPPFTALIGDELSDTCWIGSPWKWVGFMIPIYLCILLNIVLFVMVARIIIKAGKQGSSHGHAVSTTGLIKKCWSLIG